MFTFRPGPVGMPRPFRRLRVLVVMVVVCLVAFGAAGCGGSSASPTVQMTQATLSFRTGPYDVTIAAADRQIRKAEPVKVTVSRAGRPVVGATVTAVYDMTVMKHGVNTTTGTTDASGTAVLRFGTVPMGGSYRVRLTITPTSGRSAQALVFVQLGML